MGVVVVGRSVFLRLMEDLTNPARRSWVYAEQDAFKERAAFARSEEQRLSGHALNQPMKPRLDAWKWARFGKIAFRLAGLTPNHDARVAPYSSIAIVGIQRPLLPESSGPPRAKACSLPYMSQPC